MKRVIARLLILAMLVAILPVIPVHAAAGYDGTVTASGAGVDGNQTIRVKQGGAATVVYTTSFKGTTDVPLTCISSFWSYIKFDAENMTYSEDAYGSTTAGYESLDRRDIETKTTPEFSNYTGQIRIVKAGLSAPDFKVYLPFTNIQKTTALSLSVYEAYARTPRTAYYPELLPVPGQDPTIVVQYPVTVTQSGAEAGNRVAAQSISFNEGEETYVPWGELKTIADGQAIYVDSGAGQHNRPTFIVTNTETSYLSAVWVNGKNEWTNCKVERYGMNSWVTLPEAITADTRVQFTFGGTEEKYCKVQYTSKEIDTPMDGFPVPVEILAGERLEEPGPVSADGYNFLGWYTDPEGETPWNFETAVTEDLTLYAKWERKGAPGTATMNGAGEDGNPIIRVTKGDSTKLVYTLSYTDPGDVVLTNIGSAFFYLKYDNAAMTYNEDATCSSGKLMRNDICTGEVPVLAPYAGQIRIMQAGINSKTFTVTVPMTNVQKTSTVTLTPSEFYGKTDNVINQRMLDYVPGTDPVVLVQNPVTVQLTDAGDAQVSAAILQYAAGKNTYAPDGKQTVLTDGSVLYVDSGAGQNDTPAFDVTADRDLLALKLNGTDVLKDCTVTGSGETKTYTLPEAIADAAQVEFVFQSIEEPTYYKVVFQANLGDVYATVPNVQYIEAGQCLAETFTPEAIGYKFTGWFTDSACTQAYSFNTPLTGDLTLYAGWKPLGAPGTVTMNGAGADGNPTIRVTKGEDTKLIYTLSYTEPEDEEITAIGSFFFFLKYDNTAMTYNCDAESSVGELARNDIYTNPVESMADYADQIRIAKAGIKSKSVVVTVPMTDVQKTSAVTLNPIEFYGRTTSHTTQHLFTYVPGTCPTVVAQNPVKVLITGEAKVSAPAVQYDREKYTYASAGEATALSDGDLLYVDSGAGYEEIPAFTVDVPEGSAVTALKLNGTDILKACTAVQSGSSTTYTLPEAIIDASSVEIVVSDVVRPTYTVTFVQNLADAATGIPAAQTVAENDAAAQPADPAAEGFQFTGWYTDAACKTSYDFSATVTDNLTLYAGWTKNTVYYTVTFDANSRGTAPGAQKIAAGGAATQPEDLSADGFHFTGWYLDAAATTPYAFTAPVSGDLTLYAGWTAGSYTVTFDTNGHGTAPRAQVLSQNKAAVEPKDPTAEGYRFDGWFTDASCTIAYDFETPVTADLTLYAKWTKQTTIHAFLDIGGHWAEVYITFCVDKGLMNGIGNSEFAPDGTMTRAMIVTMLWRLAGSPEAGGNTFVDVPEDSWYTKAVAWASSTGIVTGYSDTEFGPNDSITREQIAAILYRYAQSIGKNTQVQGDLSKFSDRGHISSYAQAPMNWAIGSGLLNGRTASSLAPRGTASRAEVATLMERFSEKNGLN